MHSADSRGTWEELCKVKRTMYVCIYMYNEVSYCEQNNLSSVLSSTIYIYIYTYMYTANPAT